MPTAPYTPSTIADIWLMLTTMFTRTVGTKIAQASHAPMSLANHLEHAASAGEHADARRGIERDHDHRHDVQRAPQQIESEPRARQQTRGDRAGADHAGRRQRRRTDQTRERRRRTAVASANAPSRRAGCAIASWPSRRLSAAQPAAVHDEDVAVDVVRCARREEDRGAREILRRSPPPGRNALGDRSGSEPDRRAAPRCCRSPCSRARSR